MVSKNSRFFKLYNGVHLRLYAYVMTIVHSYDDTEDILQETATVLWEKFDEFEEGTNFGAWAITIARNKALQHMQKNRMSRMVFDSEFYEKVSDYSQQNSEDVSDREKMLGDCIEKLSERNRKLLFLRYKKSISIKKISSLTGRTANAIYQSFWKITQALRDCIQKSLDSQGI